MPILGWYIGATIEPIIANFDHWVAVLLLGFVAAKMYRSALNPSPVRHSDDPSRGLTLVMLAVATSIDALAVGLSLKMLGVSIWFPATTFGIVTLAACLAAIQLGARVGAWLDKQAQLAGGTALILIAARIVITHTA